MKALLPYHPAPIRHESHRGYLNRLAVGNGTETFWEIVGIIDGRKYRRGRMAFWENLPKLVGLSEAEILDRFNLKPEHWGLPESEALQFIEPLPRRTLCSAYKICVECYQESPHVRREWDLSAYVICEKHRRYLADICERCRKRQLWYRRSLEKCSCGGSLIPSGSVDDRIELSALIEIQRRLVLGEDDLNVYALASLVRLTRHPLPLDDIFRVTRHFYIHKSKSRKAMHCLERKAEKKLLGTRSIAAELFLIPGRTLFGSQSGTAFLRRHEGGKYLGAL